MGNTNLPHLDFGTRMRKKLYNRDGNGIGVAHLIPAPLPSLLVGFLVPISVLSGMSRLSLSQFSYTILYPNLSIATKIN